MRSALLLILVLAVYQLADLQTTALWADKPEIERLVSKYGKDALVHYILQSRDNRITVSDGEELLDFTGPPDADFVTMDSIRADFEKIGVNAGDFEAAENMARLQRVELDPDVDPAFAFESASSRFVRYKAKYGPVTLRTSPSYHSAEISRIPRGVVVEAHERQSSWIKVELENRAGWAPIALEPPEPQSPGKARLVCSLYGTRVVGNGKYRSFIKVQNGGDADFSGSVAIYGYSGDQIVFYGFQHFQLDPVPAGGGRTIFLQTAERVTHIETVQH